MVDKNSPHARQREIFKIRFRSPESVYLKFRVPVPVNPQFTQPNAHAHKAYLHMKHNPMMQALRVISSECPIADPGVYSAYSQF